MIISVTLFNIIANYKGWAVLHSCEETPIYNDEILGNVLKTCEGYFFINYWFHLKLHSLSCSFPLAKGTRNVLALRRTSQGQPGPRPVSKEHGCCHTLC